MMNPCRKPSRKPVALTYWSPSAGNLVSSIVWSLGADLRIYADAVKVLRLVSKASRREMADLIGEDEDGCYRHMEGARFGAIRAEAIETVIRCIDACNAPNNATVRVAGR